HQGAFDISYLRHIPNLILAAPMDEVELRNMLYTAELAKSPFAIRYPRGNGHNPDWRQPMEELEIGRGRMIAEGSDVAILSIGTIGYEVGRAWELLAAQDIHPAHYDMRFVKPLDEGLLHSVLLRYKRIVTVEDNVLQGGFGSALLEFCADNGYSPRVKRLGIPDRFIEHGTQQDLYHLCGYDAEAIATAVKGMLGS
nr:1-deoxy-D-xylulose-5-phosphate synthase [Bacteroidales bacterium]